MMEASSLSTQCTDTYHPWTDTRLWSIPRLQAGNAGKASISEDSTEPSNYCYMGYPMMLSPIETQIVQVLLTYTRTASELSSGSLSPYLPVSTLITLCGKHHADSEKAADLMTAGQLAVHVRRINQKALDTGGRRLILSHKHDGYRLNPYM